MAIVKADLEQVVFAVFAQTESSYELVRSDLVNWGISLHQIKWCNPSRQSRYGFIQEHQNQWLCFLDHDCRLKGDSLQVLADIVSSEKSTVKGVVYSGYYVNPSKASYLQKAHNLIANTWVEHSFRPESKTRFFLGGAFIVKSDNELPDLDFYKKDDFWGAEDKYLSYLLQDNGFKINSLSNFTLEHSTTSSWYHFIRRAFLHGRNESKLSQYPHENVSYDFWLRRVGVSGLYLWPAILLHFCIQRVARLTQKAPQKSKLNK